MTDQLTQAYKTIRADFMPAERATDAASAQTARLLATLLEQRAAAGVTLGTGAPLIRKLTKSLTAQIEAREEFIMAHKLAAKLARELGITGFGDTEDCPPDDQEHPRRNYIDVADQSPNPAGDQADQAARGSVVRLVAAA